MNAPEDQNGLREALARHFDGSAFQPAHSADQYWGQRRRDAYRRADTLIAGPLASLIAERDEADRRAGAAERQHKFGRDSLQKADHWKRERKAERGYHDNVSFDRVWDETCALADRALAAEARFTTVQATLDAEMEIQAEVRASLRAAEAEITRLKEGMKAARPDHEEPKP